MTDTRADTISVNVQHLARGCASDGPHRPDIYVQAIDAALDGLQADAAEQRAALAMLWQNYLLPISDEQKAQVVAALEKQA